MHAPSPLPQIRNHGHKNLKSPTFQSLIFLQSEPSSGLQVLLALASLAAVPIERVVVPSCSPAAPESLRKKRMDWHSLADIVVAVETSRKHRSSWGSILGGTGDFLEPYLAWEYHMVDSVAVQLMVEDCMVSVVKVDGHSRHFHTGNSCHLEPFALVVDIQRGWHHTCYLEQFAVLPIDRCCNSDQPDEHILEQLACCIW